MAFSNAADLAGAIVSFYPFCFGDIFGDLSLIGGDCVCSR